MFDDVMENDNDHSWIYSKGLRGLFNRTRASYYLIQCRINGRDCKPHWDLTWTITGVCLSLNAKDAFPAPYKVCSPMVLYTGITVSSVSKKDNSINIAWLQFIRYILWLEWIQ